jgi:hypothetical protein
MARTKSLEDMSPNELVAHSTALEQQTTFYNQLLNDPSTRSEMLKLLKKKNPTMPIPEIDGPAQFEDQLAKEAAERQKLEDRVRDQEIRERISKERIRVMREHGLDEADMIEVEKIMVDKDAPIPHYDAAAKVFKASRVQATPTSHTLTPRTFDMPTKDVWGPGVGNKAQLNKIATAEAYKAMNEITGGKKAA